MMMMMMMIIIITTTAMMVVMVVNRNLTAIKTTFIVKHRFRLSQWHTSERKFLKFLSFAIL